MKIKNTGNSSYSEPASILRKSISREDTSDLESEENTSSPCNSEPSFSATETPPGNSSNFGYIYV